MLHRQGFTLMEIIVVLIIIGIVAAATFPSFNTPSEQARAENARNNLLAIYSAQQNYYNNNNAYCASTANTASPACTSLSPIGACGDSLAAINCNLSLNIQDDGTYLYTCTGTTACQATRNNPQQQPLLTLYYSNSGSNNPIVLTGPWASQNPECFDPQNSNTWCP